MTLFHLHTAYQPRGNQPKAIQQLVAGVNRGEKHQVLLGITGSGKTFTMAHVIQQTGRPTLILAPNKTLAAQLFTEMRELFPEHAVQYFVSYYDYYQPEAYIPTTDTYIAKDALINDAIDRMRHAATHALLSRRDVIIVASVSCIYGIGDVDSYHSLVLRLKKGEMFRRDHLLRLLVDIQYERNDIDFHRSSFRVRGDIVDVFPAYEQDRAIRIEFFGGLIDSIKEIDPIRGNTVQLLDEYVLYPGSHYVTHQQQMQKAIQQIREELTEQLQFFEKDGRLLEKNRLDQRTQYDLEIMEQMGFCHGIENYSRHLSGRKAGEPPPTLIDYFPKDFLLIIDESHQTIPQLSAMYKGDRSRKETLVEFGFRLPSALDNRPLKFEEFESMVHQVIYVSATPGDYEIKQTGGVIVEQIVRPTGLMDPPIEVRPVAGQVDHLLEEIRGCIKRNERVLCTTLTKRMAEDLTDYYRDLGIAIQYLHSDIDTLKRVEILRDLRLGEYDVLVGINLLREGLDLPEVALVAIFDADKEGFLRNSRSLIQTIGRAARNVHGRVIMYADKVTDAMRYALEETARRRQLQAEYNERHGVTPTTVVRAVMDIPHTLPGHSKGTSSQDTHAPKDALSNSNPLSIEQLRIEMMTAAEQLEFEKAAHLRDQIKLLEGQNLIAKSKPQRKRKAATLKRVT
ncbi:excinuclease ABC subunit UvrB [Pajaroellobacter abortibovis]|uniref:UvrABC system protein B n=1 Tax=Pajaroellobacter abortibovis TaxID=1882918 RepID=A0A1L6MXX9_9BACT|nr:excinuclease ABC subunit UvrB [Pajaroellobacter abortibovis]APS00453.1 excinuclease ABC subunit B [Pajaroellobacter abortibovis]